MAEKEILNDQLHWYKDAIIYELHIKAFKDSNGDGIGDFSGLLEKLDYLQELGVTAIWVLPFYPSPLKDDGYDIADYYSINPSYGNIEQFKEFLQEAHKRNLKVITELVINHTSDQHPWFQRARSAPKGSPERDYYVWSDDPNQWKDVRIIFTDYEASNWTWDPVAQQYYWHRFFHHQPDLNYDSPLVQEEIFKILDYWCAMGVDGFRLDAVPYLFEREGTNGENLPETHAFLKKLRKHIDEYFPGTVFLAEANMWPEDSASYFGNGDECHMNYHFPVMPRMFMALQREDRYPITDIFDQTPEIPETCQWAMFLRNHDELTLEMVTDEERDYMYKVYAKDPKAKINLGIRHRLAPLMDNNRRKIELMNSLLFSLPGTPVIYYGDEIGMGDNFYLGDRDGVRTPMQWSPDRNAGFSAANPHKLYLPVILDPEYNYESVNVEMQRSNTSSLFWYMKRIINMRKRFKAFSRGDMKFINVDNPKVLAFTRSYGNETILVIVNLSKYSQPSEIPLKEFKGLVPVEVFSKNRFPLIKDDAPYFFTLAPYDFQWFQLEKAHPEINEQETLATLQVNDLSLLLSGEAKDRLENEIIPAYLNKAPWFNQKRREVYGIQITNSIELPLQEKNSYILLLEVTYTSGLPEMFQLPVSFITAQKAKDINDNCPVAVIAQLQVDNYNGLLVDGFYISEVQEYLVQKLAANEVVITGNNRIEFRSSEKLKEHLAKHQTINARMHEGDQKNTSITFDNCFFLKMYRQVDRTIHTDVEISKYLSDTKFEFVPEYLGTIELKTDKETITLGMLQTMIENHGNGYTYMMERLNNFIERILARDRHALNPNERIGSWKEPVGYDSLPEELKILLGGPASEQARLLGIRTAQMHLALANAPLKDFKPEEFSLHYQRSLFSSMQSIVREAFDGLNKKVNTLPDDIKKEAKEILYKKNEILTIFKRIYSKKFDVQKIRIHGNYHLSQVLYTGKDLAIQDFSGNPNRSFSEKRLKRSPLRDVAAMIRSFHYTAHEAFLNNNQVVNEDVQTLMPFAEQWAFYMSGFFIKAYLETVADSSFIPKDKEDLEILLQTFLMEKAVFDLNYEVTYRPNWIIVPLGMIKSILEKHDIHNNQMTATNIM